MRLKRYDRWDNTHKFHTKNCVECKFYVDNTKRCQQGNAYKKLVMTEKPRKCQYWKEV